MSVTVERGLGRVLLQAGKTTDFKTPLTAKEFQMLRLLHVLNLCLALFLSGAVTGCAHLQMHGMLPPGATVAEIGKCDVQAPFDLDAKGEEIAFADGGLRIRTPGSGRSRLISADSPCALAWSPDGRRIAAAFCRDNAGSLRIYGVEGGLLAEVGINGRITGLAWRSMTEILAFDVRIKQFTFGANLAETILQWDGTGKPKELASIESTLRPSTMKEWKDFFMRSLTLRLSPQRDEILYASVKDPPAFTPYLRIVLHNLESGKGREIAKVSLDSGGAVFLGAGEAVLIGDGNSGSRVLDPWGDRVLRSIPTPGREMAVSPGGRYEMLDGTLYREGVRTASFQDSCKGLFSGNGGHLAMECDSRLYMISGLGEDLPAQRESGEIARLKELKKWLSEGLITPQDYRRSGEKTVQ